MAEPPPQGTRRQRRRAKLEVFDDLYSSSATSFQKEPTLQIRDVHSITLYALAANSESIQIGFTKEAARTRKFATLAAGQSLNFAVADSREVFDIEAWVRNATSATTQGLYVFGLRRKLE